MTMPILSCPIPRSLEVALATGTGKSLFHLFSSTLARYLNGPLHTLSAGLWVIAGLACLQLVPLIALAQDAPSAQLSMPQSSPDQVPGSSTQGLTLRDAVQRAVTSYP